MTEARAGGGDRRPAGPMDALDRKLNVFALANGMDLDRRGGARVLGWYRDGMERRVRIEPGAADGTWAIRAAAAPDAGAAQGELVRTLESALDPDEVLARFRDLLAGAMDAANAFGPEGTLGRP
jgi:hypothetical protein